MNDSGLLQNFLLQCGSLSSAHGLTVTLWRGLTSHFGERGLTFWRERTHILEREDSHFGEAMLKSSSDSCEALLPRPIWYLWPPVVTSDCVSLNYGCVLLSPARHPSPLPCPCCLNHSGPGKSSQAFPGRHPNTIITKWIYPHTDVSCPFPPSPAGAWTREIKSCLSRVTFELWISSSPSPCHWSK